MIWPFPLCQFGPMFRLGRTRKETWKKVNELLSVRPVKSPTIVKVRVLSQILLYWILLN